MMTSKISVTSRTKHHGQKTYDNNVTQRRLNMLHPKNTLFDIPVINNVILYDETDSTNTRAKEFGNHGCVDGTLIIADKQNAGKGRMGRNFSSPPDTGIYMSLLLKPEIDITHVSSITLLAAMAVAKALESIDGIKPHIKWPNDIVINGKKVVGILTEMSSDAIQIPKTYGLADLPYATASTYANSVKYVIVGIGINVNNESFPKEITNTASSLYQACGRKLDREDIIHNVWLYFNDYYQDFLSHKDLRFLIEDYNSFLASYNREVYIIPHDRTAGQSNPYQVDTTGLTPSLCMGIDSQGALICRHESGEIEHVNAGEVSIRGLHAYI